MNRTGYINYDGFFIPDERSDYEKIESIKIEREEILKMGGITPDNVPDNVRNLLMFTYKGHCFHVEYRENQITY